MPKIDISKAAEILKKNLSDDPSVVRRIIEEMNIAVQPEDGEETAPPVKKQFVILISDPNGMMPQADFVGWVAQIEESESVATTQDRINRAAYDFNASKKGRLLPVKTVGEAIENVATKFFKDAGVWIKTRTPVLVLKTNNELPTDGDAA